MKKSLLSASTTTGLSSTTNNIKKPKEPTIALINIVFLLLIFFLAASTLAPPIDQEVKLIDTRLLDNDPPPNALVIRADGSLMLHGNRTTIDDFLQHQKTLKVGSSGLNIRLVPDRQLNAQTLVKIANQLKLGGAESIKLVTQRDTLHD
jgi:biopolymer transport protein ExbD